MVTDAVSLTARAGAAPPGSARHEPGAGEPWPGRVRWGLWIWAALWTAIRLPGGGGAWHYFAQGSVLLFGDDRGQGLHLYAAHPDLQIGPIAFLVATPLRLLGPSAGRAVAVALMSLTGPLLLRSLWRLVPPHARHPSRPLIAGLWFLPVWAELVTHAGHLDDLLALAFGVAAMHAVARGNPVAAGLLVAAAADSKPWAAAFVPLLLVLASRRADLRRGVVACALGLAVGWLPFLVYDPHTFTALRFTIPTATSSGLRVLGFHDPQTPFWDRPAQVVLGCLLGAVAVLRGRWPAVILLATAARVVLDPEVYSYYTAGLVLGAVAYDLVMTTWRWPWLTAGGAMALHAARLIAHVVPEISLWDLGLLRVAYVGAVVVVVLGHAGGWGWLPERRATVELDKTVR